MIEKTVCEYFHVPIELVRSRSRKADVAQARQLIMYFAKRYTDHDCACANHSVSADLDSTEDRRIASDRGPSTYICRAKLMLPRDCRTWVDYVGEDTRRAQENLLFAMNSCEERNIIQDTASVA